MTDAGTAPASVPVSDGSESAPIAGLSAAQFMGDIGPLRREITFEPMPDDVPVEAPVEPEKVPA